MRLDLLEMFSMHLHPTLTSVFFFFQMDCVDNSKMAQWVEVLTVQA